MAHSFGWRILLTQLLPEAAVPSYFGGLIGIVLAPGGSLRLSAMLRMLDLR